MQNMDKLIKHIRDSADDGQKCARVKSTEFTLFGDIFAYAEKALSILSGNISPYANVVKIDDCRYSKDFGCTSKYGPVDPVIFRYSTPENKGGDMDGGEGLRELLRWWKEDVLEGLKWEYKDTWAGRMIFSHVRELVKRYPASQNKPTEPLACLADRKGFGVLCFKLPLPNDKLNLWHIKVENNKSISAPTYAAAEAKARQYLESLPDSHTGERGVKE